MRNTHRQILLALTAMSFLPLVLLSSCNGGSDPDETENGDLTSSSVTAPEDTVPEINNKDYLTVIMNTAGGNYIAPRKILKGKTLSSLTPVRQGYTFLGWYLTNGEKYDFSTPVTGDLHLVAYWQKDRSYLPLDTNSPVMRPHLRRSTSSGMTMTTEMGSGLPLSSAISRSEAAAV